MSGPPPTWNDPDWPKTVVGWMILFFGWCLAVSSLVLIFLLIGSLAD